MNSIWHQVYVITSLILFPLNSLAQNETFDAEGNKEKFVSNDLIFSIKKYRESLLDDIYRPVYHFTIPEGLGIPFDPNGAFYKNGRYHLMYLYKKLFPPCLIPICFDQSHKITINSKKTFFRAHRI